ncbi:MAG: ADP-ribosylglycohydrolase family protein [Chloroflexi bacterium]|nr:ADP-ribosylglycohydrolase family protein [Chloroflexota bacterium]
MALVSRIPPDYDDRVYAGWLGKCIGVRFGAPLESWTYREIMDNLGEVQGYLQDESKIFKPDDDTSLPLILIRALEDTPVPQRLSPEEIGDAWLNYLGDQRGTIWWGGYGRSTEHTAYVNLACGIPAPLSGSIALNGPALAEQIGGQIFSDIWGLVIPNHPPLAAEYAAKASSVSHDGNGIYGGMFIAALVSQAFSESDPEELIRTGLGVIPRDSEYARVVRAMLDFHHKHDQDWRAAYHFIAENFGYDRYPGIVPIIPNAGVVVMALLYGAGDFSRAIQIANMAGWDTDCNVGNVGAIMGVAVGLEGIDDYWRAPMNDLLITASLIGTRNLLDIPACADLICKLGRELAGEPVRPPRPRYHFEYSGSTHGFRRRSHRGTGIALRQVPLGTGGALRATVRKLNRKGEIRLFVETYYRPDRLSGNYYGASFSPKIYPGQEMRARVYLPEDANDQLRAALYVWDGNRARAYQAPGEPLTPGRWHELAYQVPELHGACLCEAGLVLRNLGQPWSGSILLDYLDWAGTPRFSYDFAQEREEYGAISQWTFLRGYWRLEEGGYHGSGPSVNETYSGDIEWQDYTLTVRLVPLIGDYHNINVRVQGALRSYAFGLTPDGVTLYKNLRGYRPLGSAAFGWKHGESYELHFTVEENRLTAWVTDGPQLTWSDDDDPYLKGQIGLSNFAGCHTRYEAVYVH